MNQMLEEIPIFRDLTKAQIAELSSWLQRVEYQTGQEVFAQGSPPAGLYVLAKGRVRIVKGMETGHVELSELVGPSVFGEMGFLTGEGHSAGAVAATPLVVGLLPIDLYEARLQENNVTALRIGLNLGRITSQRLRVTTDHLLQVSAACAQPMKPAEAQRVTKRLTDICRRMFSAGAGPGRT